MDEEVNKIIKKGSKFKIVFWIVTILNICLFCFFSNMILEYEDKVEELPPYQLCETE